MGPTPVAWPLGCTSFVPLCRIRTGPSRETQGEQGKLSGKRMGQPCFGLRERGRPLEMFFGRIARVSPPNSFERRGGGLC